MGRVNAEAQRDYHRRIFHAIHDWERTRDRIVDLSGDPTPDGLLGLDQLGHFGPNGCDLVVEAAMDSLPAVVRIAELGSGFGGAIRHVVDRLRQRGVEVRMGVAAEVVYEHAVVSRAISGQQNRSLPADVVAAAEALPLQDRSLDLVMITGSMPHLHDAAGALSEVHRVLDDEGTLVITEEVSIVAASAAPGDEFRRLHPADVFFLTTLEERVDTLASAGFVEIETTDLTAWATELLRDRLKAIRLFRGAAERIFGRDEVEAIVRTLTTARDEYLAGRLVPTRICARRR